MNRYLNVCIFGTVGYEREGVGYSKIQIYRITYHRMDSTLYINIECATEDSSCAC